MIKKGNKNIKSKSVNVRDIIISNKDKLVFFILGLIDVILIVWFARSNVANYAIVNGKEIFVGKTKNLLFGRNYITLVISFFIVVYGLLINKIILKKKWKVKFLMLIFSFLIIFNMLLFYFFTNKVY